MAEIVVLGAGLGSTLMSYELVPQLRPEASTGREREMGAPRKGRIREIVLAQGAHRRISEPFYESFGLRRLDLHKLKKAG
ncbi:MAG TPA: hypothetical protein VND87_13260 [Stellaceae bacterium]|nr:hypothetical protein [Stellaceae bacterium]